MTSENIGSGWPLAFNDAAITMPLGPENYKGVPMRQADFFEELEAGTSKVKALWIVAGNPVHNCRTAAVGSTAPSRTSSFWWTSTSG